jgi:serine-type D-Ala-D-Ala carboxypeptidase
VSAACALLLAGCDTSGTGAGSRSLDRVPPSSSVAVSTAAPVTTTTEVRKVFDPHAFDATDALLGERVRSAAVAGGMIRIVAADGTTIHEHAVGDVSGSTPLSVASSTKWLTAATFMTFVDQRAIGLDDDISRWLPEFGGSNPPITARQLLDHTSGVRDNPCQSDGSALATCVRTLASSPREFAAGSKFSYGNSPFLVVGRLVEHLGGADFATVVRRQLSGPLEMDDTTWPGAPTAASPAFGATITVDDYGKFLDMILHDGVSNGTRVLSSDAVRQMLTNQVADYDTSQDYSVGITRVPRYGLGCWLDVQDGSATAAVVSGNGGKGLYPWVDFTTHTWGIVGVQDERGAQVAVPASQMVEIEARSAVAR